MQTGVGSGKEAHPEPGLCLSSNTADSLPRSHHSPTWGQVPTTLLPGLYWVGPQTHNGHWPRVSQAGTLAQRHCERQARTR